MDKIISIMIALLNMLMISSSCEMPSSKEPPKGMKCLSHPIYKPGFYGELMRSWQYKPINGDQLMFPWSFYQPRYKLHQFAPKDDLESKKYQSLDLFFTGFGKKKDAEFVTLHFQRQTLVYLFVSAFNRTFPPLKLPGWSSEGWATIVAGDFRMRASFGVTKKRKWRPSRFAYVFSKPSCYDQIVIPNRLFLNENLSGTKVNGRYFIMLAEKNGTASKVPEPPEGIESITPGGRCPNQLHDLWRAPVRPGEDDVSGRTFKTAHPLWDPCFWCAYDHEHGSIPQEVMGYAPRFGYVALKNGMQNESHNGFKGIMLRSGDYYFYYGIHAHLSRKRRFFAHLHTVTFAAVHATEKKLVMELGHKGDFGFLSVRKKPNGLLPVNREDAIIRSILRKQKSRAKRIVNIINIENLNQTYLYRDMKQILKGRYEQWFLRRPMCGEVKKNSEPIVDFKNPGTALKERESEEIIKLGKQDKNNSVNVQSTSQNRDLRTKGFKIGDKLCGFDIPSPDGVFYTDKYGTKLKDGPGPDAITQFIEPNFLINIAGRFMAVDTWTGMHEKGKKGRMIDIGFAIDPESN